LQENARKEEAAQLPRAKRKERSGTTKECLTTKLMRKTPPGLKVSRSPGQVFPAICKFRLTLAQVHETPTTGPEQPHETPTTNPQQPHETPTTGSRQPRSLSDLGFAFQRALRREGYVTHVDIQIDQDRLLIYAMTPMHGAIRQVAANVIATTSHGHTAHLHSASSDIGPSIPPSISSRIPARIYARRGSSVASMPRAPADWEGPAAKKPRTR